MRRLAAALSCEDAAQGVYDLARSLGAPTALKDIGMPEAGLDQAADLATRNAYFNPRELTRAGLRQLLDDAYWGKRPAA